MSGVRGVFGRGGLAALLLVTASSAGALEIRVRPSGGDAETRILIAGCLTERACSIARHRRVARAAIG
jgi:hypothetical protein